MAEPSGEQDTFIRILSVLDSKGIPHTVHPYSARSITEAGESPLPLALLAKTVVFQVKDKGLVLAVLKATDKVDLPRVAQFLKVNRSAITLAPPDDVLSSLGCAYGNVSPIDPNQRAVVLVDSGLSDLSTVYCGAGTDGKTLGLRFADLIRVTKAHLLDLARR